MNLQKYLKDMVNEEKTAFEKNAELKNTLLEKGFYVSPIGRNEDIEYLVVSALPPKESKISGDKPN